MREIDEALDGDLDYLFVATSTAGTLRGCIDYLRANERPTEVVAVDAVGSALFGGRRGTRRLPGFGAGVETDALAILRVTTVSCGSRTWTALSVAGVWPSARRSSPEPPPAPLRWRPSRWRRRCPPAVAARRSSPTVGAGYLGTVYDDEWVERELGCDPARLSLLVDGSGSAVPHP